MVVALGDAEKNAGNLGVIREVLACAHGFLASFRVSTGFRDRCVFFEQLYKLEAASALG